jgi:hypothetical protein
MPAQDTKTTEQLSVEQGEAGREAVAKVEAGADLVSTEEFERVMLEAAKPESDSISSETEEMAKRFMDNGGSATDRASLDAFSRRAADAYAEFKIDLNTAKLPLMSMEDQMAEAKAAYQPTAARPVETAVNADKAEAAKTREQKNPELNWEAISKLENEMDTPEMRGTGDFSDLVEDSLEELEQSNDPAKKKLLSERLTKASLSREVDNLKRLYSLNSKYAELRTDIPDLKAILPEMAARLADAERRLAQASDSEKKALALDKTMVDVTRPVELNAHVAAEQAPQSAEATAGPVYDRATDTPPAPAEAQPVASEPQVREVPRPPLKSEETGANEAPAKTEVEPSAAEKRAETMRELNMAEAKLQAAYAKAMENLNADLMNGRLGESANDRFLNDIVQKLNQVKAMKKGLIEMGQAAASPAAAAAEQAKLADISTNEFFKSMREEKAAQPPEEPLRDFMPKGDDELGSALRPVRAELGIKPDAKLAGGPATESMGDADEAAEAIVLPTDSEALVQKLVEDRVAEQKTAQEAGIPADSDKLVGDLLTEQGLKPLNNEKSPAPTEIKDEHEEPWTFSPEMTDELVRLSTKAEAKLRPLSEIEAMADSAEKEQLLSGRLTGESLESEAEYARSFNNLAERVLTSMPADNTERAVWTVVAKKNNDRLKDLNRRIKALDQGAPVTTEAAAPEQPAGPNTADEIATEILGSATAETPVAAAPEKEEEEAITEVEDSDIVSNEPSLKPDVPETEVPESAPWSEMPDDIEAELNRLAEMDESNWKPLSVLEAMPESAAKDELLKARLSPESLGREADYMQQVVDLDSRMMATMEAEERDKYMRDVAQENALRLTDLNERVKKLSDANAQPNA